MYKRWGAEGFSNIFHSQGSEHVQELLVYNIKFVIAFQSLNIIFLLKIKWNNFLNCQTSTYPCHGFATYKAAHHLHIFLGVQILKFK